MKTAHRQNLVIYLLLLGFAAAGMFYGKSILAEFPGIRLWNYTSLLMLLAGIPFLFLQGKAGVPDFTSSTVSQRQRFLYPALIGVVFGMLDVLVIKVILHPQPYTELPPFLQPFPYSIFLYFSGAFDVEVFYRLIPMSIFLLMGKFIQQGKYYNAFFWTGAVLTAVREPLEQLPDGNTWLIIYSLITGFGMNFLQAVCFKRAGFLATLMVRWGHYIIWHILLGIYVQYWELV